MYCLVYVRKNAYLAHCYTVRLNKLILIRAPDIRNIPDFAKLYFVIIYGFMTIYKRAITVIAYVQTFVMTRNA